MNPSSSLQSIYQAQILGEGGPENQYGGFRASKLLEVASEGQVYTVPAEFRQKSRTDLRGRRERGSGRALPPGLFVSALREGSKLGFKWPCRKHTGKEDVHEPGCQGFPMNHFRTS